MWKYSYDYKILCMDYEIMKKTCAIGSASHPREQLITTFCDIMT